MSSYIEEHCLYVLEGYWEENCIVHVYVYFCLHVSLDLWTHWSYMLHDVCIEYHLLEALWRNHFTSENHPGFVRYASPLESDGDA